MDVTVKLVGVKEIDAVLRGLPAQLNHKVLQSAHQKAVKPTVDAAKLLAPEGPSGKLIDSIGVIKTNFSKATELGEIQAGPRRGRYKGNAGHLVEYGTKARYNKRGAYRGIMKKKPFMQPAWDKTKNQVVTTINTEIGRSLHSFMKRTIRNG
jgi:hypothetical protein